MASEAPLQHFTPLAMRVVQHAKEEAQRAGPKAVVDSRHLLLGLAQEQEGAAAQALTHLGVTLERLRQAASRHHRRGTHTTQGWSESAWRVLEDSLAIAEQMNGRSARPPSVDTEHVLLALIRNREGGAVRLLSALGVAAGDVERETLRLLKGEPVPSPTPAPAPRPVARLIDVNTRFGYDPTTGVETTPQQVRRAGERWGVARAYTFSLNAARQDAWRGNQETLELCAQDSFFRPAAVISPLQYRPAKLVDWVKAHGFACAHIFPEWDGFTVEGQACRDLLTACGAAGLPVMIPARAASPVSLLRGLDGLRVTTILTNVRYGVLGEVLALAGRLPNLYVETSILNTPDGIALAAEAFGADHLLFGSEYPHLQVGCAALLLRQSGLSPEHIAQIGGANARRLFEGGSHA